MNIKQREQSGLLLTSSSGFVLGIDIGIKTNTEKLAGHSCDAMLISHIHGDHFFVDNIMQLKPKDVYLNQDCIDILVDGAYRKHLIEEDGEYHIGDFTIQAFSVNHGPNVSNPHIINLGFLITCDEQTFYFAGDMYIGSGIDVKDLACDYVFLPIGGHYTFGPHEALAWSKQFQQIDKLIPMHFENNPSALEEFNNLLSGQQKTE